MTRVGYATGRSRASRWLHVRALQAIVTAGRMPAKKGAGPRPGVKRQQVRSAAVVRGPRANYTQAPPRSIAMNYESQQKVKPGLCLALHPAAALNFE